MPKCGKPSSSWKPLGAIATVSGVGFFDIPHENPHAVNFAELHPAKQSSSWPAVPNHVALLQPLRTNDLATIRKAR
jgi:hypothetical protein